ncbi:MAG TPA: protein translocase subunit SecF [Acidothermaceae bacterium]
MSRLGTLGHKLYTGQASYEFVGRWRRWLALSGVVILIGIIGLATRGLSLSLEFKGGTQFTFPDKGSSVAAVTKVVVDAGAPSPVVEKLSNAGLGVANYQVQTKPLTTDEITKVTDAITSNLSVTKQQVSLDTVGSSWGSQITHKAVESLIIFLVAIVIYLSLRYEWKMAAAAIIALIHDLIITTGIYALVGFDVSPSTVIGLLTILGYSLYDTVVVFDKVRENTAPIAGGSRYTYAEAANLAVNQTLVRSINTSIIALLPVASLLFVGAGLLGGGSLKDLALALFVGLATGSYSSIFIATPLLVLFKEREPQYIALTKRVSARVGSSTRAANVVAAAAAGAAATSGGGISTAVADRPAPIDVDNTPETVDPPAAGTAVTRAPTPPVRRPGTPPRRQGGRPSGKKRRR